MLEAPAADDTAVSEPPRTTATTQSRTAMNCRNTDSSRRVARVVEFLNEQMDPAEVLALEVRESFDFYEAGFEALGKPIVTAVRVLYRAFESRRAHSGKQRRAFHCQGGGMDGIPDHLGPGLRPSRRPQIPAKRHPLGTLIGAHSAAGRTRRPTGRNPPLPQAPYTGIHQLPSPWPPALRKSRRTQRP